MIWTCVLAARDISFPKKVFHKQRSPARESLYLGEVEYRPVNSPGLKAPANTRTFPLPGLDVDSSTPKLFITGLA